MSLPSHSGLYRTIHTTHTKNTQCLEYIQSPTPTLHTVYKHKHTTKYHTQHTNKKVVLTSVKLPNCWQPLCCKAIWGIPPLVNSSGQTVFRSYQATTHSWLVGNSCKGLTAQWLSVVCQFHRGKYHLLLHISIPTRWKSFCFLLRTLWEQTALFHHYSGHPRTHIVACQRRVV